VKDCDDGSDEKNCDCEVSKGKFLCQQSKDQCIDLKKVCDGIKDCTDGSDENEKCQKDGCKDLKCDFNCVNLPTTGPTCICREGYQFNSEKGKCEV
jgi:hypothetical protein